MFVLAVSFVTSTTDYFLDQKIDHFNPLDSRKFQQLYYVNDTYYQQGGPVFLVINGEAGMPDLYQEYGYPLELAQTHNALVISLEHRYYGTSLPFGEDSFSTENLQYLNTDQALADLAQFRHHIFQKYNFDSTTKVFGFGCSYSGVLSAWFRTKYPHLIDGAFSGSSPVLSTTDFTSYNELVESRLPTECVDSIGSAVTEINNLLETIDGRNQLQRMFNTCQELALPFDVQMFKFSIIGGIQYIVQYNNPPDFPQISTCDAMNAATDKLAEFIRQFAYPNGSCLLLDPSRWYGESRSWYYQKATEFGFFKNSPPNSKIFFEGVDADFHKALIEKVFGQPFYPDVDYTNTYYGGKDVNWSNIIFTNGINEPWSLLSITDTSLNSDSVVVVDYDDAGHCAPYHYYNDKMPPGVLNARKKIDDFITKITSN
ncbi:protease s28 pro-x carboxypeptidase-related [Anaeramoeba flamelloides]|uniref:Protease s28 pro-x carboxypeptidase-related n=1 Tax=Anaeramoeba flamelloides TaxID=1746091 RepID=A0AAV7ZEC8_9EUKA|nr:protease s28 pro-x carboxypeptidase-related [Anaeramoeba flamelloides]|eukprot:Anaeramoba_flamelloidesa810222_199.p1 GENE.a810222_199~~a810222_199.p1  ORF type:complete len:449 (+),score=89.37 a810222_199:65-1348(+)